MNRFYFTYCILIFRYTFKILYVFEKYRYIDLKCSLQWYSRRGIYVDLAKTVFYILKTAQNLTITYYFEAFLQLFIIYLVELFLIYYVTHHIFSHSLPHIYFYAPPFNTNPHDKVTGCMSGCLAVCLFALKYLTNFWFSFTG